jgi:hypothetical protein
MSTDTAMTDEEIGGALAERGRTERRLMREQARAERRLAKAAKRREIAVARLERARAKLAEAEAVANEARGALDAAIADVAEARWAREDGPASEGTAATNG